MTDFCVSYEGLNIQADIFMSKDMRVLYKNMETKMAELYAMMDEEDTYGQETGAKVYEAEDEAQDAAEEEAEEDDDDNWTDIDSDEDEDEDKDDEEPECDVHEVTHAPLFEIPSCADLGECVICFEDINAVNMLITRCGHSFHASCCIAALAESNGCPLCRAQLI